MPTPKQPEKRSELRPAPPSARQSGAPPSPKGLAAGGSFTMPSVTSTSIPAMGSAAFGGLETREPLTEAQIDGIARGLLAQLTLEEKIGMIRRHAFLSGHVAPQSQWILSPASHHGRTPRFTTSQQAFAPTARSPSSLAPPLLARHRVEAIHETPGGRHVHDAVDDKRRRRRAAVGPHFVHPSQANPPRCWCPDLVSGLKRCSL